MNNYDTIFERLEIEIEDLEERLEKGKLDHEQTLERLWAHEEEREWIKRFRANFACKKIVIAGV